MPLIRESALIEANVSRVWSLIRDFNALPEWHPLIANSRIEAAEPADRIGCIRNFRLHDGGQIREQLLALSDHDFCFTYSILESQMPVRDYISTLELTPVTDTGHTMASWSASFNCAESERDDLENLIGKEVFVAGLKALVQRFIQT